MKSVMRKVWVVQGVAFKSQEFTVKSAAYRLCRTLNGKKAGARREYTVQRLTA
jgi:hypothetical protein